MSDDDALSSDSNPWRNQPAVWEEQGFESLEAWFEAEVEEERNRRPGMRRKRAKEARLHPGEAPERPARPMVRSCQVNVRLTPDDLEALERAAAAYGVATATMAQMLVNRGLEAVAREESGERAEA